MKPAARLLDIHVCGFILHIGGPILPPCSTDTIIWGLPAARVTDRAFCLGPPDMIVTGSSTCLINNLPAARLLDTTAHGGKIIAIGAPSVLIGG